MPTGEARRAIRPSRRNLYRVSLIRVILLTALAAILIWARFSGAVSLPWLSLCILLIAMAVANALILLRIHWRRPVCEMEFFANLLLDVGFLTALLYLTGGSTNPLVSYYLIPLIISAAVLRPRYTWAIAVLTVVCYTFLLFRYVPLDLFAMPGHGAAMGAHFLGMWISFVFSAVLIAVFVVRMAMTMREQDRAIARFREQGLRDEQIVSVASIAAGTAHELRTPLATMTVLAGELREQHPEMAGDLGLLQDQVGRCDAILRELLNTTAKDGQRETLSVGALFQAVRERWSVSRPEVVLEVELPPHVSEVELSVDQSLRNALLSFLNNAADMSPDDVRLAARSADGEVLIAVEDRGPGIPEDIADSLGRRYVSRRDGGLGLGVLLSSASIERLDGEVRLTDRPGGGTRLEIRLPAA